MNLTDMKLEDLKLLTTTEIAYRYLKENKVTLKTPDLFRKVCDLLKYNDTQYMNKIGEFYTTLTMDKRFIVLDNNEWDLRQNHSVELVIDDDDTDVEVDENESEDEELEEDTENLEQVDNELDDSDDDLEDLTIVDEDDMEE